eukprot:m51a1_g5843 putative leucine-rich repeat-containing protein (303) ;mRNA; f:314090-315058
MGSAHGRAAPGASPQRLGLTDLFNALADDSALVVDLRDPDSYESGRIRGAVLLPAPTAAAVLAAPTSQAAAGLLASASSSLRDPLRAPQLVVVFAFGAPGDREALAARVHPARPCAVLAASEDDWRGRYGCVLWYEPGGRVLPGPMREMPSEVVPGLLFLGGWAARAWTAALGITHVANARGDVPDAGDDEAARTCTAVWYPVQDSPAYDIAQHFAQFVAFVEEARARGGRVLVHCAYGISRSATLAAAYVMARRGLDAARALEWVRSCRPIARPNPGFVQALRRFNVKRLSVRVAPEDTAQ